MARFGDQAKPSRARPVKRQPEFVLRLPSAPMQNRSKLKRLAAIALGSAALAFLYESTGPRWETVSSEVTWPDPPVGGGDFYLDGSTIMSLTVSDPVITLKPASEWKRPMVAEPVEAWMNNAGETLNRRTANFFRGTIDHGLQRYFQAPGQKTAWWHSRDGNIHLISASWMSYTSARTADDLVPHQTQVWKSLDGGRHWSRLEWPEHDDIDQFLFIDAQHGYAIGWGPTVRRTSDGGGSWKQIAPPPGAVVPGETRRQFEGVNLGPDGVLRVAYHVDRSATAPARSVIYRLAPDQQAFVPDAVLPDQTVVRLESTPATAESYALYVLSRLDNESRIDATRDRGHRTGVLSTWTNAQPEHVRQVATFDKKLILGGLDVGHDGLLLVYAIDPKQAIDDPPVARMFSSTDAGKTWKQTDDETIYHSKYFDPDTNTLYSLLGARLKKLSFPMRNTPASKD